MCDPLTLGTLAIGAAGTAANAVGQASAAKKQKAAYDDWAANQKKIREAENVRQEDLRKNAETAQQQGLQDISGQNQAAVQTTEEERLKNLYSGDQGNATPAADPAVPTSVADARLTGSSGGGEQFQQDLATKLSDAAASAKQRIGAMATINSYGGSYGGLGTVNPIAQETSGAGIDKANDARKGSLAAYGIERNVDPLQISYSNPLADVASSFLDVGMNRVGGAAADAGGLSSINWFGNPAKTVKKTTTGRPLIFS